MPATPRTEIRLTATERVRDMVVGLADGLTVPFALATGLSVAVTNPHVIVTAGLAAIAAAGIATGLGGYLAARTAMAHYDSELARERDVFDRLQESELQDAEQFFRRYGLEGEALQAVTNALTADRSRWVDFMVHFELGLEKPGTRRATASALTIGVAYVVGGLVPLVPYMMHTDILSAFRLSVLTTAIALFGFGAFKGHFAGMNRLWVALETLVVGGLAATGAFLLAHGLG